MLYKINTQQMPDVRYSGQITFDRGWTNDGRVHQRNMLLYIVFGHMRVEINGSTLDLSAGDYLFIPGGTYFRASLLAQSNYRYVHFTPPGIMSPADESELVADMDDFAEKQRDVMYTEHTAHTLGCVYVHDTGAAADYSDQLDSIFRRIDKYHLTTGPVAKAKLDLTFFELLLLLSENALGTVMPGVRQSPVMSDMLLWIARHYNEKTTLDTMSQRFSFSKQHIIRLFNSCLGQTVIEYINGFRLQKSLEMLGNTDIPVGDIALSLGFSSSYYFARLFSRAYGMTPTAYRNKYTKK